MAKTTARTTITLPIGLADEAREKGVNISDTASKAVRKELKRIKESEKNDT